MSSMVSVPIHLNDHGVNEWRRIIAAFEQRQLLDDLNLTALEAYCASYGAWIEARLAVKKYGQLIKDKDGKTIRNPMLDLANQHLREWRAFMKDLGMIERATGDVEPLELAGGDPAESRDPDAFFLDAPARQQ